MTLLIQFLIEMAAHPGAAFPRGKGRKPSLTALVGEELYPIWASGMRLLSYLEEAPSPVAVNIAQSGVTWFWGSVLNAVVDLLSRPGHWGFCFVFVAIITPK